MDYEECISLNVSISAIDIKGCVQVIIFHEHNLYVIYPFIIMQHYVLSLIAAIKLLLTNSYFLFGAPCWLVQIH